MQRLIRFILISVVFLSLGIEPVPHFNRERDELVLVNQYETIRANLSSPFTMDKLADIYDWIGNSFVVIPSVDLPGESEVQKKWFDFSGRRAYQTSIALLEKMNCSQQVKEYLFNRHIQGFYIYVLNKLLV